MKLVHFNCNWADEFDCEYIKFYSDEDWDGLCEAMKKLPYPQSFGFGTNQDIEFASAEEFLSCCKVVDVDESFEKIFREKLGIPDYNPVHIGVGPDPWYDLERLIKPHPAR